MDKPIGASEASRHFSKLLRGAKKGESYVILSRGRPVARLVPAEPEIERKPVADLIAFLESLPRSRGTAWTRDSLYD